MPPMLAGSRLPAILVVCAAALGVTTSAGAQGSTAAPAPRPWGRVSFYSTTSRTDVTDGGSRDFGEYDSSITYQLPDQETDGLDFGVDIRHSAYAAGGRPARVSIYEGFVGARLMGGRLRARIGHLWLNDLGALGSVAGAAVEYRQPQARASSVGRWRFGAFGGLEPQIFEFGYASNVTKAGAFVALDGEHGRRNVLGFVTIRDRSLTERAVLTTTNFLPLGKKVFVYQAAEYDVSAPAGHGRSGLAYLFANARVTPTDRLEIQGTYSRGRSVDTRSLTEDVLSGRPLTQSAVQGLFYESVGGRLTVEVVRHVRVYGGYSRDVTNRDDAPTGRVILGGFASNVLRSGFDLTASDSITDGPTQGLHSQYVSLGRQIGRSVYVYGDYSTSLSVLLFSRSDGVVVETRPHTRRVSGTATITLPRSTSLMLTLDRTADDQSTDLRVMAGITYRFR